MIYLLYIYIYIYIYILFFIKTSSNDDSSPMIHTTINYKRMTEYIFPIGSYITPVYTL